MSKACPVKRQKDQQKTVIPKDKVDKDTGPKIDNNRTEVVRKDEVKTAEKQEEKPERRRSSISSQVPNRSLNLNVSRCRRSNKLYKISLRKTCLIAVLILKKRERKKEEKKKIRTKVAVKREM